MVYTSVDYLCKGEMFSINSDTNIIACIYMLLTC